VNCWRTVLASVRDLEYLIAIGQRRPVSEVLQEIMQAGDERQTWELGVALKNFHDAADQNPILMQAWNQLPFRKRGGDLGPMTLSRRSKTACLKTVPIGHRLGESPADNRHLAAETVKTSGGHGHMPVSS
jgi:hypothetical protein